MYHLFEDGMREVAGEKEARKNDLIQAIEEKADHHEYRAGRRSLYDELERLLPKSEYHHVLSIIDRGYSLLEDKPLTEQIAKELWSFSRHVQRLVEEREKELQEKYPEWFNENLRLHVQLSHPLNRPPSHHSPSQGIHTIVKQLSGYLKPYFITKTGIAEMIAQLFLYFYGRDYPEIDPKKIARLL